MTFNFLPWDGIHFWGLARSCFSGSALDLQVFFPGLLAAHDPPFGSSWKAWRSGPRRQRRGTGPRWAQTCCPWAPGHHVLTEGTHPLQRPWTWALSCVMRTESRKRAARKPFGVSAVFTYSEHEAGRNLVFPSDLNTHLEEKPKWRLAQLRGGMVE